MKKIIIPFNGDHFAGGAFAFAGRLNDINPILLTGVFLPEVDYARFFFFPVAFAAPPYLPPMAGYETDEVDNNVDRFARLCQKRGIEYRVHKNLHDSPIAELTTETRFADAMIIGSQTFYHNTAIGYGSDEYLTDALRNTECPVIIVPENYDFPSEIILAYDGSASSVFAIKQFVYLFPQLCKLQVTLVYAGDEKHDVPDQVRIEELAARHFQDLTITKIPSNLKNNFSTWFNQHTASLLVSGSFGRSGVSAFFGKSFVSDIIKEHKAPVFIAHN